MTDATHATREQLLERPAAGNVVVLDVRAEPEYAAGHVPDALSIIAAELQQRLVLLPDNVTDVPYCRGPFGITAAGAVRTLTAAGRQALRLVDGYPQGPTARLPVERDSA